MHVDNKDTWHLLRLVILTETGCNDEVIALNYLESLHGVTWKSQLRFVTELPSKRGSLECAN